MSDDTGDGSAAASGRRRHPRRVDEIDKQLISLLQQDGRAKYTELGRVVGISEALARVRVERLRRDGVIQIVAVTDPLMLGFSHEALIGVQARSNVEDLVSVFMEIDEIDFIVLVAGEFDILLEIVAANDEQFLSLIQRIRDVVEPGVVRVLPYLATRKQEYSWGVR